MSGLALILFKRGYSISGSDKNNNQAITKLKALGITIFDNQSKNNIKEILKIKKQEVIIIVSSAIPDENDELKAAKENQIKILHRSDILSNLIDNQSTILVAGSHGKTTTSTLITTLFALNNQKPTAIIGGIVPYYNSNANAGDGEFLIAEADESDGSLIKYKGTLAIITNLELDHTDLYKNINDLIKKMTIFGQNSEQVLANYDCNNVRKCNLVNPKWCSTKYIKEVNFSAIPIKITGYETIAKYYEEGRFINQITIPLPGLHNLSNALSAIAACRISGIEFTKVNQYLKKLESPNRRFEFKGIWKNRQIVDDYGHHPSEIRETIKMARLIVESKKSILPLNSNRLVLLFQPHRYSRTKDLMKEFAEELGKVDVLILAPIYSAGEKPIEKINLQTLKSKILSNYPKLTIVELKELDNIKNILEKETKKNDLIVVMGAGNINKVSEKLTANQLNRSYAK